MTADINTKHILHLISEHVNCGHPEDGTQISEKTTQSQCLSPHLCNNCSHKTCYHTNSGLKPFNFPFILFFLCGRGGHLDLIAHKHKTNKTNQETSSFPKYGIFPFLKYKYKMHATGCRKNYLFKLKSEKQHTSCTDTSVADAGIKIRKDNTEELRSLCCGLLSMESSTRLSQRTSCRQTHH